MKISQIIKESLIEMYEEKYEYNRVRLNMDGARLHYDEEDLDRMRKENEMIRQMLEELRKEN
jgi:hypothetical protein